VALATALQKPARRHTRFCRLLKRALVSILIVIPGLKAWAIFIRPLTRTKGTRLCRLMCGKALPFREWLSMFSGLRPECAA